MQLHRDQKYVLLQSDWDARICDFEYKINLYSVKLLFVRRYYYWFNELINSLISREELLLRYDSISGVSGIPEAFVCWVGWEVVGVSIGVCGPPPANTGRRRRRAESRCPVRNERITEEEAMEIERSGLDPMSAPPGPYTIQPDNQGKVSIKKRIEHPQPPPT